MAGRLEKLLMRVELIDKVTGTANRIANTMDNLQSRVEAGFTDILKGVGGLWGASASLTRLTSDYHDFHRALGEVSSLSVADDALQQLQKSALKFSIQYGESAADFVRSSYDIQSAIAGLVGSELAVFTEASNVLAKGTKADAATITNYMGTMYGIFKNQADAMGKANWVKQLTGQTAQAVEMFKTNGVQMSGAFTALGADATAHGIAINEQMAVLGKLQATMSGSEAGTKYKAFLRGVGAAQEQLGMKFTDSAGRMLPVDQILAKLQGKFGAIDTVAKSDMLKKAFGSDEAVAAIKLLIADTNGLSSAIDSLGSITGMEKARAMAEKMTMKTDQLKQAGVAVRIGFGALVDKALMPFYDAGIKNLSVLSQWIDKYPNVFGALAKLLVMVAGVTAAVALLAIIKGVAAIAATGFGVAMTLLRVVMVPFGPLLKAIRLAWVMFNFQLALGNKILPAAAAAMRVFRGSLLLSAKAAWAFSAALLANPITWIVVGVVALVAGLALLITHWDSVSAAGAAAIDWLVGKWQAFRAIIEDNPVLKFIFQPLLLAADFVGVLISALQKIPDWFTGFKDWLISIDIFGALLTPVKWLLDKLKLIPGLDLNIGSVDLPTQQPAQPNAATEKFAQLSQPAGLPVPTKNTQPVQVPMAVPIQPKGPQPVEVPLAAVTVEPAKVPASIARAEAANEGVENQKKAMVPAPAAPVKNVPTGGLQQQFNSSSQSRNTNINQLNVNTTQAVNGYSLQDQLRMAGG
ncbi:phage tail tape measure protein [Cellvibrio sp. QJXJ]|uniref:phage tail tape measure protein n=1 Tax=Cellvibrio sp. QJXJ TaxID=2964606 RepID=UPI0021C48235|nr:phage tail tape measure protein [Cellvibrio sp. QJXJ]UUA73102.1 phage tail tape measure protein [Cellvibrio sp. QJXJ]